MQTQGQQQGKGPHATTSPFPWKRLLLISAISLLLGIGAVALILSTGHIIDYSWYYIIPVIFTAGGLLLTALQWLFPLSPVEFRRRATQTQAASPSPAPSSTASTAPAPPPAQPDPTNTGTVQSVSTSRPQVQVTGATQAAVQMVFHFNEPLPAVDEFYGRVRERITLLDRTGKGISTSIVGPRRIGKTWLMRYLQLVAPGELPSHTRLVYLDATRPSCSTLNGFLGEALTGLGIPIVDRAALTMNTLEAVVKDLKAHKQVPVLCIDEFEGLCRQPGFSLDLLVHLRAIASDGLGLVTASKQPLMDVVTTILGEQGKTSPFFNIFEQITLKPFTQLEAEEFAQAKSAQAGFTDDERVALLKYGKEGQNRRQEWPPLRLQLAGKTLLADKHLAATENPHFYRPTEQSYWREFEQHLTETYRGVVGR